MSKKSRELIKGLIYVLTAVVIYVLVAVTIYLIATALFVVWGSGVSIPLM